jgi:acyl-CoA thioesterase-1
MKKIWSSVVLLIALGIGGALYFMNRSHSVPVQSRPIKIVAFGDSLTAGYGVPEEDNYPNQLRKALSGYTIEMVNLGVSGDTTEDAKERIQQVIVERPDIVLVGIGGNDALRLAPVEQVQANIESIIQSLQAQPHPPRIILLQMQAAINGGLTYKNNFDALYEKIADKYKIPLVPFIVTKIYFNQAYMLPDRIHMNKEGYAYIVKEYVQEAVEKEIKSFTP